MNYFGVFAALLLIGAGCATPAPEPQIEAEFLEPSPTEAIAEVSAEDAERTRPAYFDIGDGETPKSAWDHLVLAAIVQDCSTLLRFTTDDVQITEQDCQDFIQSMTPQAPELDWGKTEYSEDDSRAKVYRKEGGSLTVFELGNDEVWRANTLFWR